MAGIHRSAYSFNRPATPNTTTDPLGVAPGATVTVYRTGTLTLASLYTNSTLTTPLANPFTTDVNGYFQFYCDPAVGDLDEQYSGTGIATTYTLPVVLDLDPRITATAGDVGTLTTALAAETAARAAADTTLQTNITAEATARAAADTTLQTNITAEATARAAAIAAINAGGFAFFLGGSLIEGLKSASQMAAFNRVLLRLNGTTWAGYTATVYATVLTENAGTTVQPILRNLTTAANVGTGSASASLTAATQTFAATLAAGSNDYELELQASNATNYVFGSAYLLLTK